MLILLSDCQPPEITFKKCLYELGRPDQRFTLPHELEEISGISWMGKGKLACIEDENGIIYLYSLEDGAITDTRKFDKDGDYEDIAVVGNTAYVLESKGDVFRVKDFRQDDFKVKRYKTRLSKKNNAEGLAYDSSEDRLLIALKGSPAVDKEKSFEGYRAVYALDPGTEKLAPEPVYLVDLRSIDSYRDQGNFAQFSSKLARILGITDPYANFRPSGIAIHPLTGEIYIISSVGKLLIVLDRDGLVLGVQALDPGLYRQPEGICFSPGGDLYISSEGRGGKGYILKFKPKPDG